MRKSIRRRITLIFIGLMAAVLAAVWAVNGFWLEKYYTKQKLQVMEEAYEKINTAVVEHVGSGESLSEVLARELEREWEIWSRISRESDGSGDGASPEPAPPNRRKADGGPVLDEETRDELDHSLLGTIRGYSERNNIMIVLIDSDTGKTILNSGRDNDFLARKAQRYILGMSDSRSETLIREEDHVVEKTRDHRSDASYLESWGFFADNKTMFIMQMPLASIRESVILSNRFTTYVGLAALVFGSILMYLVTRQVTNPILKLAELSERMSKLDFEARYEGGAQDEVGVLGNSMNVLSEKLKETIGELQDANVRLQHDIEEKIQIDEMRKEFIANVSHELKTPIALIQGYAEGLTEGMAEDQESRNYYCEVIGDEAAKMNQMVKQLLTLTALEFGNDVPEMARFDIHELIRDLLDSAAILLKQNEAAAVFEASGPRYVWADEFKIEEVLNNYLSNAMNHLSGGRVIRIRTEQAEDTVTVWVFNSGEHIPEADIPNLWTKFFKVDKARTRAYGGSGIGLSIVKAVMDAHHQRCGAANVEGGVEFWFTLQAAEAPEA